MKSFASVVVAALVAAPVFGQQTFNNCSGAVSAPPPALANATLPQLGHGERGWEEWELTISEAVNSTLFILRWTLGDPASQRSNTSTATFDLNVFYGDGSSSQTTLNAPFQSTSANGEYSISIGNNTVVWTDAMDWYNVTVDANGFTSTLVNEALPSNPLTPAYGGKTGQLVDGLFSSMPVTRGHINGPFRFPDGAFWLMFNVASLKHSYAREPVQSLLKSSVRGVSWVGPDAPAATVDWYEVEDVHSHISKAAQLSTAIPVSIYYQATNDPSIFNLTSTSTTADFTFAGCSQQGGTPFVWNTSQLVHVGDLEDSAGGVNSFYTLNVTGMVFPFNGSVDTDGIGIGFFEVYTPKQHQQKGWW